MSYWAEGIIAADPQFTIWVVFSNDGKRKAELGDIWGGDLPLELRSIDCDRENISEKSCNSLQSWNRLFFPLRKMRAM